MIVRAGDLIDLIIRERFGTIIEKVVNVLRTNGPMMLIQIKHKAEFPINKVREALCILIKYRIVKFQPSPFNKNISQYEVCVENILLMLRYPRYMILIKKKFGDQCEMIIEELLQNGYLTPANIILKVAERTKTKVDELNDIKDKFISLVVAKYIKRKLPQSEATLSVNDMTDDDITVTPKIDMNLLIQAYTKKIEMKALPTEEYWTVNFDRFHQDMRDQCIVDAFINRNDPNAGEFVNLLLQQMYIRTDPWAESSNPVPLVEIKQIATKKKICPELVQYFDEYVKIIEQDSHLIIVRAGEASGGSLQIHLKKAYTALAWEVIEKVILQKYDSKATRIFRLIREREFVDTEQLEQIVMLPLKNAKAITYQLVQEKFLKIRSCRKPTFNSGPVKSPSLLYVDLESILENIYSLCFTIIYNTMSKRHHLYESNRYLLKKQHKFDMIVMLLKAQNATEEQIAEFEENITPPEREIITKVQENMKKLHLAELEMDSTIFIIEMYLKYTFSNVTYV